MSEFGRSARVELRTAFGTLLVMIDVGPLATDDAAVDMARRKAEIDPKAFVSGEVVLA